MYLNSAIKDANMIITSLNDADEFVENEDGKRETIKGRTFLSYNEDVYEEYKLTFNSEYDLLNRVDEDILFADKLFFQLLEGEDINDILTEQEVMQINPSEFIIYYSQEVNNLVRHIHSKSQNINESINFKKNDWN